jgi:hypothetical protein
MASLALAWQEILASYACPPYPDPTINGIADCDFLGGKGSRAKWMGWHLRN